MIIFKLWEVHIILWPHHIAKLNVQCYQNLSDLSLEEAQVPCKVSSVSPLQVCKRNLVLVSSFKDITVILFSKESHFLVWHKRDWESSCAVSSKRLYLQLHSGPIRS